MISVILPALDEEQGIVASIEKLREVFGALEAGGCDIVVVDDGSSDRTAELSSALGARVVRHPHNLGYGRSIKDGIAAAANDTLVIADADGTYPLDRIPSMLEEYRKGFEMVVGARHGRHYRDSLLKFPLRLFLKWLVEFATGRDVPDVNSGLRVFSKATVQPSLRLLSDSFSFTTSLTLCYMMTGRFVAYVPIPYHPRVGTSKVRLVRDSLRTLQYIVQALVYFNPVKAFLLPCLACLAVAGFAFVAAALGMAGALMVGLEGLLAAVVVFSLGLLAVMLHQTLER
jgi:glycosyltransferase involved in cell wall biosynthesis